VNQNNLGACVVCSHPKRTEIDEALLETSHRKVAKRFETSESAMYRHKKHVPGMTTAMPVLTESLTKVIEPLAQKLTGRELSAAFSVAEDRLSDTAIAETCGVKRAALARWKKRPEFQQAVEMFKTEIAARVLTTGIAVKTNRIKALNTQFERIERVIAARAADPDMQKVPGGDTGTLAHDQKSIGSGLNAEVVDVYEFDAALDKARSNLLEQTAKEVGGAFEEKPGGPVITDARRITFNFPVLSPEDLAAVENAPYADLPAARPRLLIRPSDGAQR
jgi:hypothetical protein